MRRALTPSRSVTRLDNLICASSNRDSTDLCGFPGGSQPRRSEPRGLDSFAAPDLQIIAARAAKPIPARDQGPVVSSLRPKQPRFRLDRESYEALRKQILARDNWRCQNCGASETL